MQVYLCRIALIVNIMTGYFISTPLLDLTITSHVLSDQGNAIQQQK